MSDLLADKPLGPRHPLDTTEVALDFTKLLLVDDQIAAISSYYISPVTFPPLSLVGAPSVNAVAITIDGVTVDVGKAVLFVPTGGIPDVDYLISFQVVDDSAEAFNHGGAAIIKIRDGGFPNQSLKAGKGGAYSGPRLVVFQNAFHRVAYGNALVISYPNYLGDLSVFDSVQFVATKGDSVVSVEAEVLQPSTLSQRIVIELTDADTDMEESDLWQYQLQGLEITGTERAVLVIGMLTVEPLL